MGHPNFNEILIKLMKSTKFKTKIYSL